MDPGAIHKYRVLRFVVQKNASKKVRRKDYVFMDFSQKRVKKGSSRILLLGFCIFLLILSCACTIKSNKKIDQKELDSLKTEFEDYLKATYPNETFTVDIWTEYGTGSTVGLPDFEGDMLRHIVTDSKGNRFRVYKSVEGSLLNPKVRYSDDYQLVLDGRQEYNEKGQTVLRDDDGNIISEYY